jgi:hypothetical protein
VKSQIEESAAASFETESGESENPQQKPPRSAVRRWLTHGVIVAYLACLDVDPLNGIARSRDVVVFVAYCSV